MGKDGISESLCFSMGLRLRVLWMAHPFVRHESNTQPRLFLNTISEERSG